MSVPKVAIVGRPNVGKSSLFNWLCGLRLAIVDDMAGVTRDRMSELIEAGDERYFEIIDTGGIGIADVDNLTEHIEDQIQTALGSADLVLFLVDARTGLVPLDVQVAERLRHIQVPTLCVANKTDDPKLDPQADEFYQLGFGTPLRISCHQQRNRQELIDSIFESLPDFDFQATEEVEPEMKLAIVGRRNVGKSTLVNTLVNSERMIVSEIPGTTRDSVNVRFELDGKTFVAIDTPGLRKRKSIRSDIDFYGSKRAERSIRHADVVLMMFDASQRLSRVDKQLVGYIDQNYKPCIFVVNKWDKLANDMPTERWVEYLRDHFRTMWHVPIAFITGQSGRNVKAMLNHAQMLFKQSRQRISTGELNRLIESALAHHPPPLLHHRRPKIYYATQVSVQPPTIVLMCNNPKAFTPQYRRYLLGVLRDQLSFGEVPIRVYYNSKKAADETPSKSE